MVFISILFQRAFTDLNTIANGSIPSINAAQAMTQYIEDIDAKSADFLAAAGLTDVFPCQIAGTNQNLGNLRVHGCDKETITAEIALANQKIYETARNVTYPGERTAIERIIAGFQDYRADIARMQYEYSLAKDPTDATTLICTMPIRRMWTPARFCIPRLPNCLPSMRRGIRSTMSR